MRRTGAILLLLALLLSGCSGREQGKIPGKGPEAQVICGTVVEDGARTFVVEDSQGAQYTVDAPQAELEPGSLAQVTCARDDRGQLQLLWVQVLSLPQPPPRDPVEELLDTMTLEEQVGQMFLARCPKEQAAQLADEYHLGGYVLFGRDFRDKSRGEVAAAIASYQGAVDIPLLLAVDEEGGTVNRISTNPQLAPAPFPSPRQLYDAGGLETVRQDTREKCALLRALGIQVNLAPVCDVAQSPESYMYPRTLGQDAQTSAAYVAAVVEEMAAAGVGSVLKHFPGYGENLDTHTGQSVDHRPLEDFETRDFLPFQAGIAAGCGAVLVSHNIMAAVDGTYPASLSPQVHRLLREQLGFEGVILTDDLEMAAVSGVYGVEEAAVLAVLAGNDLLCTTDFIPQIQAVVSAAEEGRIPLQRIREGAGRVLRWKAELGLLEG